MTTLDVNVAVKDASRRGLRSLQGNLKQTNKAIAGITKGAKVAALGIASIAVAGAALGTKLIGDVIEASKEIDNLANIACLLYTSPSPRDS